MSLVKLDLNNPDYLTQWFQLEKNEAEALRRTLERIVKYEWDQLYSIKGLHWERITSKATTKGNNLYSFRFSGKYRVTGYRDGAYLLLLNLHPDHDSAYGKK